MAPESRRLAAIMFTDAVGFTALMAESEERGLRVRERHRALVGPLVRRYGGKALEIRGGLAGRDRTDPSGPGPRRR